VTIYLALGSVAIRIEPSVNPVMRRDPKHGISAVSKKIDHKYSYKFYVTFWILTVTSMEVV
jgi:hypothetical protein